MIYEKPKNEIFASDAKDGEIVEFPNVKRGWGITENLGFIPPMEYFNAAFNRVDKSLAYQLQRGIGEWDKDMEYPIGAVVSLNGIIYIAKSQNTNKNPVNEATIWDVVATQKWCDATFFKKTDKIDAYTKRESDDKFALKTELTDGLPIGAYLSYPSQKTIPAGFLIADGRSLKKAEYTELFDVVGYTYGGSGDNFNLPNFADGKFMRGIGGKAAPLGTAQQDELKSHIHNVSVNTDSYGNSTATLARGKTEVNNNESGFIKPTGGNETRPYNMAVVVILKAKNVNTPTAGQIDKTILATETKAGITKLKNSITAQQEDAAVTEKALVNFVEANKSIGVDQAYQDVWSQRELNTYYPNTTGRPIMVGVDFEPILVDTPISVVIDDQIVRTAGIDSHIHVGFSFVVPAGSKYKIATLLNTSLKKINLVADVTNKKYNTWNELK